MTEVTEKECLDLLKEMLIDFSQYSDKLRYNKFEPRQRAIVFLYNSLLELCEGIACLLDSRQSTPIPILLRSILEGYVDFKNLVLDEKYQNVLELMYAEFWLKIMKEAKKGTNEYLSKIGEKPELDSFIRKFDAQTRALKKDGVAVKNIAGKFRMAGLYKEYKTLYSVLCGHTHNGMTALLSRHIESNNEDFEIVVSKDYSPDDGVTHIQIANSKLFESTLLIHLFFESGMENEIDQYAGRLAKLGWFC